MLTELTNFKNKYAGTFHGEYTLTGGGFGQIDYVYQNELHGFTDSQLNTTTGGRLHITSMTMTNISDHSYFVNAYATVSSSTLRFAVYPGAILHANSTLQLCAPETPKVLNVTSPFQYNFRFQAISLGNGFSESAYVAGDVSYTINWVLETSL